MNYLILNHSQIESIQSEYPLFDSDELQYAGALKFNDESMGDFDKSFSAEINWLEVKIEGKWVTIIFRGKPVKGALFELTLEQGKLIEEHLLDKYYAY